MQSQGNRLNIMSRKSQKKRNLKRIPRVSPRTRSRTVERIQAIPKGVREYHVDPRVKDLPSNHRIEPSKPKTNRQIIRDKTCTLTLTEVNILTDDDRYKFFMKNCSLKSAKKFLQRNDPNVLEKSSEAFVFHLLVRLYEFDKVKLYIEYGMDVNHRDKKGRTALVRLAENVGYSWLPRDCAEITKIRDMIELLVDNGADPNIPDNYGNISLHYCGRLRIYLFSLFVYFGCNKFHINNQGQLPVSLSSFWHPVINEIQSLFDIARDIIDFRKINITKLPAPLRGASQSVPRIVSSDCKPIVDYNSLFPNVIDPRYCTYAIRRH